MATAARHQPSGSGQGVMFGGVRKLVFPLLLLSHICSVFVIKPVCPRLPATYQHKLNVESSSDTR